MLLLITDFQTQKQQENKVNPKSKQQSVTEKTRTSCTTPLTDRPRPQRPRHAPSGPPEANIRTGKTGESCHIYTSITAVRTTTHTHAHTPARTHTHARTRTTRIAHKSHPRSRLKIISRLKIRSEKKKHTAAQWTVGPTEPLRPALTSHLLVAIGYPCQKKGWTSRQGF